MRNYKICLDDILIAIEKIENSMKSMTREKFERNVDIQDVTIMRILIIGETVKSLSNEFKKKYPEVEWKKIAGTRDIIIHSYFKINLNIVWDIVTDKIPKLKRQIKEILEKEK